MDIPRPVKYALYGFIFFGLVLGIYKNISWFGIVVLGVVFYITYRFMAMQCHHRYTGVPMALMLVIIAFFGIIDISTISLLGIFMLADIFI